MSKSTHENYHRAENHAGPSNRSFGLTVGGILFAFGAFKFFWRSEISIFTSVLLAFGLVLIVFAIVLPKLLTPLNNAWMALGLILGKIVNPIVMLLVFCVAIVPTSVILKLRGYDPLRLKKNKAEKKSHWIERDPPGPDPDDMINQF
jgi:hypothetical protein